MKLKQMKLFSEQFFPVVLFILFIKLFKVVLASVSVHEILKNSHSNKIF